jgi:hypothetical protein
MKGRTSLVGQGLTSLAGQNQRRGRRNEWDGIHPACAWSEMEKEIRMLSWSEMEKEIKAVACAWRDKCVARRD